jgi:hypothetical protein
MDPRDHNSADPTGPHQPRLALTALVFTVFALASTWPLAGHLATHVLGAGASDNLTFVWSFWWARQALGSPEELFHTTLIFHPYGTGLAMHTHAFFSAFLGATVLAGWPIIAAQNLVILSSVALNGLAAYLLAWWLTRRWASAMLAGLYFAASPYFAGHLHGHFNLVPGWTLPLFVLAWLRSLERATSLRALAAGLVFALTAWTDYYYAAYLMVFVAITLAVRWVNIAWAASPAGFSTAVDRVLELLCVGLVAGIIAIKATGGGIFYVAGVRVSATTGLPLMTTAWALLFLRLWRRWRPLPRFSWVAEANPLRDLRLTAIVGLVAAAGTFPILREAVALWRSGGFVAPPGFLRSAAEGVDPISLFAGNPFHVAWGDTVGRLYEAAAINSIENTAYLGVVMLVLLFVTRGFSTLPGRAHLWRVVGVVFFIWALGPYLRLWGENTGLYLPAALLRLLPVASNLRIPGRAIVMVYLALSVLLAHTATRASWGRGRASTLIVAALIVADFAAAPLALFHPVTPAVYQVLAGMPAGAVLELPMGIRDGFGEYGQLDHGTLVYQSVHRKPMVGGFVARMTDQLKEQYLTSPLFGPLLTLSSGDSPGVDVLEQLREHGLTLLRDNKIRYVVLAAGSSDALRDLVLSWPLQPIASDDRRLLFVVPDAGVARRVASTR